MKQKKDAPQEMMDFAEAENQFQHGRQHMSQPHLVLALYEQLTIWCKSAYYLALQSPEAHIKIKKCLHEALRVIEEIQRLEALSDSKNQPDLSACQQKIEHLFSDTDMLPHTQILKEIHGQTIQIKNSLSATKKRRSSIKPSLNVNRKKEIIE